jgi:hypothetical protein
MDGLAEFIELLLHLGLCALGRLLGCVHGVGQKPAALADAMGDAPILQLDAFRLQEFA